MSNAKPREPKKPLAKDETRLVAGGASDHLTMFGSCLRPTCKVNGIRFEFGAARARCRGCDDEYSNEGDRARMVPL